MFPLCSKAKIAVLCHCMYDRAQSIQTEIIHDSALAVLRPAMTRLEAQQFMETSLLTVHAFLTAIPCHPSLQLSNAQIAQSLRHRLWQGSLHELLSLQTGHGRPEDGEGTVVDDFCLNRLCPREEGGARQTSVLRQFQRANSGVNEILGGRAESEGALASAKEAAAKASLEEKAASATLARCGSPSPPWASGWCARPAWSGVRSGRPARGARALRTASSHASKAGRATAGGTVRARWLRRGAWQKRRRRRATWCGAFFNASSLACSRSTLALSATRTGAAWPSGAPRTTTASPLNNYINIIINIIIF